MATREDIKAIIGYMRLAFPNYAPTVIGTPNTIDVLEDLLGDMDPDTLRAAVRAACKEEGRAFAPAPGEIRAAANNMVSLEEIKQERIARSFENLEEWKRTKQLEAKNE